MGACYSACSLYLYIYTSLSLSLSISLSQCTRPSKHHANAEDLIVLRSEAPIAIGIYCSLPTATNRHGKSSHAFHIALLLLADVAFDLDVGCVDEVLQVDAGDV